jgi:hypothetical protein
MAVSVTGYVKGMAVLRGVGVMWCRGAGEGMRHEVERRSVNGVHRPASRTEKRERPVVAGRFRHHHGINHSQCRFEQ